MVVNKHGSFYMRSGWGTKILDAVESDTHIFSPSNEQVAVDELGLGRIMIKALRYWSVAMGLTNESKDSEGILQDKKPLFHLLAKNDRYFQDMNESYVTSKMHEYIEYAKKHGKEVRYLVEPGTDAQH